MLELNHKPKALWSPYCSQILAHPTDPAAWAGLRELPAAFCSLWNVGSLSSEVAAADEEGDEELLRKWWGFLITPEPSAYQVKSHQGWGGDFLPGKMSCSSCSRAAWVLRGGHVWHLCILGLAWLTRAPHNLQKGYFPPVFLLYCAWMVRISQQRTLLQGPTAGKGFSDTRIDGCKKNCFRSLKIPCIRGRCGFEVNFPEEKWLVQKSWKTTQELLVEGNIQQHWLSKCK